MLKKIHHDDSDLIWFDYNDINIKELDNIVISNFDICNMPVEYHHTDICGYKHYTPKFFELNNYYVTFFEDHLSYTGYSCMCLNKDKQIYKSKIGYEQKHN